jgi:heme exporter protein C
MMSSETSTDKQSILRQAEHVQRASRDVSSGPAHRGRWTNLSMIGERHGRFCAALAAATALMFIWTLLMIARAPYQDTMGLIQKVFYVHVPCWLAMGAGIFTCGMGSAVFLFRGTPTADRLALSGGELTVLFGSCGLVTGPLWARKAWGTWWTWDAKLTIALMLELIFVSYLLVRRYAGPGSDKLAAAVGIFGMAVSPFVYEATNIWRTIHPLTTVVPTLVPGMFAAFWCSSGAFMLLFLLLLMMRVRLEEQRAALEELYLAQE